MPSEILTHVSFQCDGPKCEHKPFGYIQQRVQEDPNALPDDFFRVIEIRHYDEEQKGFVVHGFLSAECARQWFKSYVPPRSPRELAKIAENNAAIDASKNKPLAADVDETRTPVLQELEEPSSIPGGITS